MVDYLKRIQRPLWKKAALAILSVGMVNRLTVKMLGALPDSKLRQRVPVKGASASIKISERGKRVVLTGADSCTVARTLYWTDGELPSSCERLALALATKLGEEAELFLDIGAYTGLFSLAVASTNEALVAHAYEIVPQNHAHLWRNVIANDMAQRIEPRLVGIGAAIDDIRVPVGFGRGVMASAVALDSNSPDGVAIPVKPLDELYSSETRRTLMKIDVEKFAPAVLEGGRSFIKRTSPDIICEVLKGTQRIAEMEQLLKEANYVLYHITNDGLGQRDTINPAPPPERDWLFSARSPDELSALGFRVKA